MATGAEVLSMLLPDGGWAIAGDDYEAITFIEATPITKAQFIKGFEEYDIWKENEISRKAEAKAGLLARLGITAEEAELLLA